MNRVSTVDNLTPIRHVLISAYDKTGLPELVAGIVGGFPDVRFYSTGGTYRLLRDYLPSGQLIAVSDYTGQPEIAGGLVKSLDYKLYLGLLSERYSPQHVEDRRRTGAVLFDLVVCNLYPFQEVIANDAHDLEDARGNIDIGGPTMVRAAAKNFLQIACLTDPQDYPTFLTDTAAEEGTTLAQRYRLATKAFEYIAGYDRSIAHYFATTPLNSDIYTEATLDG